jgi:hypothetical protein
VKIFRKTARLGSVSVLLLMLSCSLDRARSSDELVERLNAQIKSGNFEQIYNEADSTAKDLTPKAEFFEKMNSITGTIKEIDDTLSWQKDEQVLLSNEYRNLYFVYRKVEKNGKKLDVTITVAYRGWKPEFYDLCVSPSESSTTEFEICATGALRKI